MAPGLASAVLHDKLAKLCLRFLISRPVSVNEVQRTVLSRFGQETIKGNFLSQSHQDRRRSPMAVNTNSNRVLNVVSVVRDVVTDNKSMVCGTAITDHAPAVHLTSHQPMQGYQQRPWQGSSSERTATSESWRCWLIALRGVALPKPTPLANPDKRDLLPDGLADSRKPGLIGKRLTDKRAVDARGFTRRMAMSASKA